MSINTIIGQAAQGEDFFPRPDITNQIWEKLEVGSNLLLVAPRRVGKSSILFNLQEQPNNGFIVIYYTSESVNSENEFYKKLYHHLLESISNYHKYKNKMKSLGKDFLSRIEGLSKDGIQIGQSKLIYLDEIHLLIKSLNIQERLLILIDEFSQTIENIIQDINESAAIHFLETKREIRQIQRTHKKLQFVYAGSIGLENIVSKINSSNLINDLVPIEITPLSKEEAKNLTNKILEGSDLILKDNEFNHLLEMIEWWIPFYFQLIIDEVYKTISKEKSNTITEQIINEAVNNALKQRIYFEQWLTRLRKAFKGTEFTFIKELLNIVSEKDTIASSEIHDLAVKFSLDDKYFELLNALKYDGYINNLNNTKIYRFNSPLLKKWWYQNVTN